MLVLITKVSLHTFPPPDPEFLSPQTFSPFIVMEKAQQVKCSLPMIGNIVYGPLIRLEMEVNPTRHGDSGRNVTP